MIFFDVNVVNAKVTILLQWNDTRLQWRKETGIGSWKFPEGLWYPISEVWVPNFRLANCQSEKCVVRPQELKLLALSNSGKVQYEAEMMLRSTCSLDLTCTIYPMNY